METQQKAESYKNEMICLCGETLKTNVRGGLWDQYQQHMKREDHKATGEQWTEAANRMAKWKESAKKSE